MGIEGASTSLEDDIRLRGEERAVEVGDIRGDAEGFTKRRERLGHQGVAYFLRLWRLARRRLRYLCFDIFLRRFLMREPMEPSDCGTA